MRLVNFYIFLLLCLLTSSLTAQDLLGTRVSVSCRSCSTHSLLEQISDQLNCQITYNPNQVENKQVSVDEEEESIELILDKILEGEFIYLVRGRFIVLNKKEPSNQVNRKVLKGVIKDSETGEKLENVSVYEVTTLKASITDSTGYYQLKPRTSDSEIFIGISRTNYRDTVVRIDRLIASDFEVNLTPEKTNQEVKKKSIFNSFLLSKKVKKHTENVRLDDLRRFQLSLVPGVSTNGFLGSNITNNISVNMVGGFNKSVKGVEFGGVFNLNKKDMSGFQAGGVINYTGNSMVGFQAGGVSNIVRGYGKGIQVAGVSNNLGGRSSGVQIGGVTNFADFFSGLQISGVYNHSRRHFDGLQISGVVNYARSFDGLMIGVVNIAHEKSKGLMLGLVNLSPNGFQSLQVSNSGFLPIEISYASGKNKLYSILTSGSNFGGEYWSFGLGLGSKVINKNRFGINVESVFSTVLSTNTLEEFDSPTLTSLSTGFFYNVNELISIEVAPVFRYMIFNPEDEESNRIASEVVANPILSEDDRSAWLDYKVALRFTF